METGEAVSQISLDVFDWQWDETDKDANFKQEMAVLTREDPMPTIETMSRNLAVPVGAIVRYILVKWAASGSTALLEMGPRVVTQMADIVEDAERTGTDEGRLGAYEKLSGIISWLNVPLNDPEWLAGTQMQIVRE